MLESFRLLGINSSGLERTNTITSERKNEDEVFIEATKLNNPLETENYLKKILKGKPHGFIKAKLLLAELLKEKDLKYSFDLIHSARLSAPVAPECYLLLAEIAVDYQAWLIAKGALETVKWLCPQSDKDISSKADKLLDLILNKINEKVYDSSNNEFWRNKSVDKYWILEKLYFQAEIKELVDYSFKLLDLFPGNIKNYYIVYKSLVLANNKEALNKFLEYIKNKLADDYLNLNLYIGMTYYHFSDHETSIRHLQSALKIDPMNSKALFYLALNYLMTNNMKDFISTSTRILPESDPEFIALYFIFSAASNIEMNKSEFPNHKNVARETSKIIDQLLQSGQKETASFIGKQFQKLSYYLILPYLQLYLAEVYIKLNLLDTAKEILQDCTDSDVHRLNAWIYRLEGKDDLAEQELIKYRKTEIPDKDIAFFCQSISLNLPDKSPDSAEQVLKHVKGAYEQTKDLTRQFDLEYGLNTMTCMETGCQDCCTKTFPQITYTEFLYMKNWLDNQTEELKKQIYEGSNKIVAMYREKYKKDPPFMVGEKVDFKKEYPLDLKFDCPCLGDNKCNAYEGRPFTCRAYSFSSFNGITFKGCIYFFEQFRSATKLNQTRKVVDGKSFFRFAKLTDEMLIGEKVMAPIPVWFGQKYDETLEKVKSAISVFKNNKDKK